MIGYMVQSRRVDNHFLPFEMGDLVGVEVGAGLLIEVAEALNLPRVAEEVVVAVENGSGGLAGDAAGAVGDADVVAAFGGSVYGGQQEAVAGGTGNEVAVKILMVGAGRKAGDGYGKTGNQIGRGGGQGGRLGGDRGCGEGGGLLGQGFASRVRTGGGNSSGYRSVNERKDCGQWETRTVSPETAIGGRAKFRVHVWAFRRVAKWSRAGPRWN